MKKIRCFFSLLAVCILPVFSACGTSPKPVDVTKSFFTAFQSSDYEAMKNFCTDSCIDSFFHKGDVDGMVWAKLTDIGEETFDGDKCSISVSVKMETDENSALYPDTETSFFVVLIKDKNGSWLIDDFPTG